MDWRRRGRFVKFDTVADIFTPGGSTPTDPLSDWNDPVSTDTSLLRFKGGPVVAGSIFTIGESSNDGIGEDDEDESSMSFDTSFPSQFRS